MDLIAELQMSIAMLPSARPTFSVFVPTDAHSAIRARGSESSFASFVHEGTARARIPWIPSVYSFQVDYRLL